MLGQDALAVRRQNEHCEAIGSRGRACHHCQPIIRADRQSIRQIDDLLANVFLLRHKRTGAVGQKDIGAALGDVPAIDAAVRPARAGWWRRRSAAAPSSPASSLAPGLILSALRTPRTRSRRTDRPSASRCRASPPDRACGRADRRGRPRAPAAPARTAGCARTAPPARFSWRTRAPADAPCWRRRTPPPWRRRRSRPSAVPTGRTWPAPCHRPPPRTPC